jgi:anti-repressor protein
LNNLVTLTGKSNRPVTTSKMIAEVFEKEHKHVLRDIDNLKDVSNFGLMFFETSEPDSYGRSQRVYQMNRDGFSLLAMGFTGQKALEWKVKYIEAFNYMERQLNTPELQMAHGLLAAKTLIEQKDKLIAEQKQIIEEQKPKALFADAVSASDSSVLVRDLAKMIRQNGVQIGEKRLYKWMRDNGFVCKGSTMPTQKAMELGLFEIIVRTVERGNGLPMETKTAKVTGKGQIYFVQKFLGAQYGGEENE